MERVLVTGATGFIGGHCVVDLLEHGYPVRATVRDRRTAEVGHLRRAAERVGGSVEFVEATLDRDGGWARAVDGCAYVLHVASPAPKAAPRHEDDVVRPAVDGTSRVLRAAAASGSVRRVVLTSSIDAIRSGRPASGEVLTEADWSVPERCDPYAKSKTLAERAAWDFVAGTPLELAVLNPGLVLGPLLRPEANVSVEVIRLLLSGALPAVPRLGFAVADVRDIAEAHRLAMLNPEAAGQRFICAGEHRWMGEIAAVLAAEYRSRGFRVPTAAMPYALVWLAARFDRTLRLALPLVGRPALVSSRRAAEVLGWRARPADESVLAAAESLLGHGIVEPRRPAGPRRDRAGMPARSAQDSGVTE